MESKKILSQYLFDVLTRVARFYIHLEEINRQFYLETSTAIIDKVFFINSYEEALEKLLTLLLRFNTESNAPTLSNEKFDYLFNEISQINLTLNELHKELIHLPRPTEPIELRRFNRVIGKQIVILSNSQVERKNISIYVNEDFGESTFRLDPLYQFKESSVNALIQAFNVNHSTDPISVINGNDNPDNIANTIHITIPRIEANNPCHWPTLMHEVAHTMMRDFFREKGIEDEFFERLSAEQQEELSGIRQKINISSWLTECWCDIFAAVSIGHSFWFSQYHSFINVGETKNRDYPPCIFRLKLIKNILKHRFSRELTTQFDENFDACEGILVKLNRFEELRFYGDIEIRNLFQLFRGYFLRHFFLTEHGKIKLPDTGLNEKFQKIVKYVNEISPTRLNTLLRNLEEGLPIPSIRRPDPNGNIFEDATSIQEILFAAWAYRNSKFKDSLMAVFNRLASEMGEATNIGKTFKERVLKEINRFDQSILRSIQVQEWFDLLNSNEDNADIEGDRTLVGNKGLLTDFEIKNEILENRIKVVPIISFKHQIGTTSLDIRLGTSFQIFFPNQSGVVDFTNPNTFKESLGNSKNINLDFLESITLTPSQFILGHSMEYIKLSETISADLEGRSSFARLGIEIHMTAGFIEPGFEGVLTFEIFNAGPNPVRLYPGLRIGQLRFNRVNEPAKAYTKKHAAKYSGLLEHRYSLQGLDYEVERLKSVLKQK